MGAQEGCCRNHVPAIKSDQCTTSGQCSPTLSARCFAACFISVLPHHQAGNFLSVPGKKQVTPICDMTDYRPAQYCQPSVLAHAMPGHACDIESGEYGSIRGFTVQYPLGLLRVDMWVFICKVLIVEVSEFQPSVCIQRFQLLDFSAAQRALAIVVNAQGHVRML